MALEGDGFPVGEAERDRVQVQQAGAGLLQDARAGSEFRRRLRRELAKTARVRLLLLREVVRLPAAGLGGRDLPAVRAADCLTSLLPAEEDRAALLGRDRALGHLRDLPVHFRLLQDRKHRERRGGGLEEAPNQHLLRRRKHADRQEPDVRADGRTVRVSVHFRRLLLWEVQVNFWFVTIYFKNVKVCLLLLFVRSSKNSFVKCYI